MLAGLKLDKIQWVYVLGMLLVITLQLVMITRVNFHPDEFRELSSLYSAESGYGMGPLKNGLHYLIWPLKYVDAEEGQVLIWARYVSFLGILGIYWMLFKLGKFLGDARLGMAASFLCATCVNFLEAAIQYRPDGLITAFMLLAMYLVMVSPSHRKAWFWPGLLMGVALFLNPKAIYHLTILGGIYGLYLLDPDHRRAAFKYGALCGLLALASFGVLLVLHCLHYHLPLNGLNDGFGHAAQGGFGKSLGWGLKRNFIKTTLQRGNIPFICAAISLGLFAYRCIKGHLPKAWYPVLLALFGEWATLFVHQGVFKYYLIDILPPLCLVGAYSLWLLQQRVSSGLPKDLLSGLALCVLCAVWLICGYNIAARLPLNLAKTNQNQLRTIHTMHELYPQQVRYFDGYGMISKYNNLGPLFIGKTISQYLKANRPLYPNWVSQGVPVFFIHSFSFQHRHLLPLDSAFIRAHYIPYFSGQLWLYGTRVRDSESPGSIQRSFLLAGTYRASGEFSGLRVNGQVVDDTFHLEQGEHTISWDHAHKLEVTFGERSPFDVVPHGILPAKSSGTFEVPETARYYFRDNSYLKAITIDGQTAATSMWPERFYSKHLKKGLHTFNNPTSSPLSYDPMGPVLVPEVWTTDH